MSSKRKLDSARANGKKSHGPVTPEGRKKSSMNALKHGLNARTVTLSTEDDDEYNFLRESYVQRFQPADLVEMDLVACAGLHNGPACPLRSTGLDEAGGQWSTPDGASAAAIKPRPACSRNKW